MITRNSGRRRDLESQAQICLPPCTGCLNSPSERREEQLTLSQRCTKKWIEEKVVKQDWTSLERLGTPQQALNVPFQYASRCQSYLEAWPSTLHNGTSSHKLQHNRGGGGGLKSHLRDVPAHIYVQINIWSQHNLAQVQQVRYHKDSNVSLECPYRTPIQFTNTNGLLEDWFFLPQLRSSWHTDFLVPGQPITAVQ